ncbi:S-layer homology domain-containing protein [Peptoniphilus senegalensis]|uniref:S-layer homology domain-containing protein n=1 Tax=Peptoniphilus senegalensis TaxID=1465757 RepID=UPI003D756529
MILIGLILNPLPYFAKGFRDVNSHWTNKNINYAVEKGYAYGYEDETFKSHEKVTRAKFLSFLNNFFKIRENFTNIVLNSHYTDIGS